jgi:SAM-dependent methyltransferase
MHSTPQTAPAADRPRNPPERAARDPWSTRKRDVPYVPTDEQVVRGMLKLAQVTPTDRVYDLGCGDGRIVIAAARRCGATGIGVEIDTQRLAECAEHARRATRGQHTRLADGTVLWHVRPEHAIRGVVAPSPTVRFLEASLFELDFSDATVVMLYLLPKINQRLIPTFLRLRPGTRIVSNSFPMGYEPPLWQPDETLDLHHRHLMKWIVPAPLAGEWRGVARRPDGSRARLGLRLAQQYQRISGTVLLSRGTRRRWQELPVGRPVVQGARMTCHLPDGWTGRPLDLDLAFADGTLRGMWRDGSGVGAVCLVRS